MSSFHDRFTREWLFESPLSTGHSAYNPYPDLLAAIQTNVRSGNTPRDIGNGLRKLEANNQATYWLDNGESVEIIAQFEKAENGLYVELVGKRPGSSVYASDFYEMVLLDSGRLIFSGDLISDQGLGIWKQLLKNGRKLFVYDTSDPSNNKTLDDEEELESYTNDRRYRFVLSESVKQHSIVTTSFDLLRTYNLTFNLG